MEFRTFTAQYEKGGVAQNVPVNVYQANTDTPVQVYDEDDNALSQPLLTNGKGQVGFKAANGAYDIVFSTGANPSTLENEQFFDVADAELQDAVDAISGMKIRHPMQAGTHEGAVDRWMHGAQAAKTVLMNPEAYKDPPRWAGMDTLRGVLFGVETDPGIIHIQDGDAYGTANAAANLIITDSDGLTGVQLLSADESSIWFGDAGSNTAGRINYLHSSDAMRFSTAATVRMTLGSTGRLGIGETSPAQTLHVKDATDAQLRLESTAGNCRMQFKTSSDQWSNGVNATGNFTMNDGTHTSVIVEIGATDNALVVNSAGINTTGVYQVSGTQVVGAQQAAIADVPTAGSATAADNATAINSILAAMRAHGLIAT